MKVLNFLALVITWSPGVLISKAEKYRWREELYRGMSIDHFSSNHSGTFDMRYLINDTWWNPMGGPIFFYPSNEAAAEVFAEGTGLMWDWAPEFGAMLVFPEHRFYGKTLPYGNLSYETPYLEVLTVDQAMEDFAVFLNWLKKNISGASNSRIIAFGGSYGGMLAAWMRFKYPSLIYGAISSSAPIRQLVGGDSPCWAFGERVTHTYALADQKCPDAIQKSWDIIKDTRSTDEGKQWLIKNFHICNNSTSMILPKINNAWQYMAMFDYPYATDFFTPLPAWPVKEACKHMTSPTANNETVLLNLYKAISVYYNYTGKSQCFSLSLEASNDYINNWIFQTTTELILPLCSNETDILLDIPSPEFDSQVADRYRGLTEKYGVKKLKTTTNIIFVNGDLDPWYSSGISQEQLAGADPSLVAISIANAAHHYDLRGSDSNDTREVIEARKKMKGIVTQWLNETGKEKSSAGASNLYSYNSHVFLLTALAGMWCLFYC